MIFPSLELEGIVQVFDRTRLNASKSFITPDEAIISLIRIKPEASGTFITVTSNKYLDWEYATDGIKVVTVEVTTDGVAVTKDFTLTIITKENDNLWSEDASLVDHEDDITKYIRSGRNSYLDKHRMAQERILAYLDERRIWDSNGDRLTKSSITDIQEVKEWSKFEVLSMIMTSLSNAVDDIFSSRAEKYTELRNQARNRAALRFDSDNDGETDAVAYDMISHSMVRR